VFVLRCQFRGGGGLSAVVSLLRDWGTEVEMGAYQDDLPLAWWKMPFEMSSFSGVLGLEVPLQHDSRDRDWDSKAWGNGECEWCQ